jgi:hypothetical protein
MLASITVQLIVLPLYIANMLDSHWFENYFGSLVISYVADLLCAIDLICRTRYFYYLQDGILYTKTFQIFDHYKSRGYLLIACDILSILPLDVFVFATGLTYLPVLRGFKLLQAFRLPELLYALEKKIRNEIGLSLTNTTKSILQNMLFLVAVRE